MIRRGLNWFIGATTLILIMVVACNSATEKQAQMDPCIKEICFVRNSDGAKICMYRATCVQRDGWDTLPEIRFWRRIVSMTKDSVLVNIIETRKGIDVIPRWMYDSLDAVGKLDTLRNEMRVKHKVHELQNIRFTGGKNHFYKFDDISLKMARGVQLFDSLGVDPFYAQCILLIESPGSNKQKSIAGAYGNFQLMPFVARTYGLRVDSRLDEREIFDRSAYAAARLVKESCIPLARKWCQQYGFVVDESSLWFKLLALHCYNAGPNTVKSAMAVVPNSIQGNKLIQTLWHTKSGYWSTEAQNYSQLAIACYLEYEKAVLANKLESKTRYTRF